MQLRRFVRAAICVLLIGSSASAGPITVITPELFAKVKALAAQARSKHPTSPTSASDEFVALFNGEFGDVTPSEAWISMSDDLIARVHTPFTELRIAFQSALNKLEPLPNEPLDPVIAVVVSPRQMTSANVTRVVLFRGTEEVKPIAGGDFGPREYSNRMGAKTTLNAGTTLFPVSAFAPGADVKILLLRDRTPIEWTWNADKSTLK